MDKQTSKYHTSSTANNHQDHSALLRAAHAQALALQQCQQYEEALAVYRRYSELDPTNASYHQVIGHLLALRSQQCSPNGQNGPNSSTWTGSAEEN